MDGERDDWRVLRDELLEDPETRAAFEAARPRFEAASRMIGLRSELGLTQAEFAERLGVSVASVIRWESGRVAPRPGTLEKIASLRR